MSGYCLIGRLKAEMMPARASAIEMTTAKRGRSMKNCENMPILLSS